MKLTDRLLRSGFLSSYKPIAITEITLCVFLMMNAFSGAYNNFFNIVNFVGSGMLAIGSIYLLINPRSWMIWFMTGTMAVLVIFNVPWFIIQGEFISNGFKLVMYNIMFIIANVQFLIRVKHWENKNR